MSFIVKQIDPIKVAGLDDRDYTDLLEATRLLNEGVKEEGFPAKLQAKAFILMRKCGVTNVRTFDGMRVVAIQLIARKLMIERLRDFGIPPGL